MRVNGLEGIDVWTLIPTFPRSIFVPDVMPDAQPQPSCVKLKSSNGTLAKAARGKA